LIGLFKPERYQAGPLVFSPHRALPFFIRRFAFDTIPVVFLADRTSSVVTETPARSVTWNEALRVECLVGFNRRSPPPYWSTRRPCLVPWEYLPFCGGVPFVVCLAAVLRRKCRLEISLATCPVAGTYLSKPPPRPMPQQTPSPLPPYNRLAFSQHTEAPKDRTLCPSFFPLPPPPQPPKKTHPPPTLPSTLVPG